MEHILAGIVGSTLALAFYPFGKAVYRVWPYLGKTSGLIKKGGYVVVAGATDGIGQEFMKYLIKNDVGVIAIGRNQQKLELIKEKYPSLMTFQIDFSQVDMKDLSYAEFLSKISQKIGDSGDNIIGMVNCVGMAHFSAYSSLTSSVIHTLNNTNINSLHFMLKLQNLLQKNHMTSEKPFFINISSIVARNPHVFSTVYAASKAYLSNLIQGVSQEEKNQVFLNIQPWFVRTKMVGHQKTWDTVGPEEIAEGAFKILGKRLHCSGCIKHELIGSFSWLFSSYIESRGNQSIEKAKRVQQLMQNRRKKK